MDNSALRYIERQRIKPSRSEHPEARLNLLKSRQEQEDFKEFAALLAGKKTSESFLRRRIVPLLWPVYSVNALVLGLSIHSLRSFLLTSILAMFLLSRFAMWTSLRREHGKELYPLRTAIGAVFLPGWLNRNG